MRRVVLLLLAASVAYADVTGRVVAVTDGDTIKVLELSAKSISQPICLKIGQAAKSDDEIAAASKRLLTGCGHSGQYTAC